MTRQLSIDNFFNKSKASSSIRTYSQCLLNSNNMGDDKKKLKRNLSLLKTSPTKIPKISNESKSQDVINLCEEDDDILVTPPNLSTSKIELSQESNRSIDSVSSASTIPYSLSPRTPLKTLETPVKTPHKVLQTSQSPSLHSPLKREKFYSPTKKRIVVQRTPMKVKRNLSSEMSTQLSNIDNDLFATTCDQMDDKTLFLLKLINKYLGIELLRDLLCPQSQVLLKKSIQVVKPGMRLVCRLYWRKEGWYKRDQIRHICTESKEQKKSGKLLDDPSTQVMINSLMESNLIVQGDSSNMTFNDFKTILNREELKQICKELKLKIQSKQDAIEALENFSKRTSNISNFLTGYTSNNSKRVLKIMSTKAGLCYKLSDLARTTLYKLYVLMYLGIDYNLIREKKLEVTLIYDKIERQCYPVNKEMVLDDASIVFRNRDEFERYMTAHNIYEDFLIKTGNTGIQDVQEKCQMVKNVYNLYKDIGPDDMKRYRSLPQWLRRYTPASIYVKILEAGVQELKKDKTGGHCLLALNILTSLIIQDDFRQHKKAEWFAEKALILHGILCRYDEAAEVLLQGFKSNLSEEAKDIMRPRARKIANQKNISVSDHLKAELLEHANKENILEKNLASEHIYKQPMDRTGKRGKVKFERRTSEARMIQDAEEYCLSHYICSGEFTDGEHWEGRIITTLFFLLFWDIIYTKPLGVVGIFLSYYQMFPLDMFCEEFYNNRREAIDNWLNVIAGATEDKLLNIMQDTWDKRPEHELSGVSRAIGWDNVRAVASCLGPSGLAAICRRLATNYRYTHSGFPDLTIWNRYTKKIKFVEVKTDTDKPSMKQIQWMHYLREHGIDTEFCYLGANTTRQRCRNDKKTPQKSRKPSKTPEKPSRLKTEPLKVEESLEIDKKTPLESKKLSLSTPEKSLRPVKIEPLEVQESIENPFLQQCHNDKKTLQNSRKPLSTPEQSPRPVKSEPLGVQESRGNPLNVVKRELLFTNESLDTLESEFKIKKELLTEF